MAEVTNILDTLQVIITRISLNLPKSLRLSMIISRQVLNNHLRRAEATHKKLTAAKCKLEHNISVKITSVNIDANILMNREVNTALRTPYSEKAATVLLLVESVYIMREQDVSTGGWDASTQVFTIDSTISDMFRCTQ